MEEWIDLGKVNTETKDTSRKSSLGPLFMKIIEGEKYYKVFGEHVKVLDKELKTSSGFAYNAVSASYYIYIV